MDNVSFIIPTRNNLPYLKLAYGSIRKNYPKTEVVILDDNSSDGTKAFLTANLTADENLVVYFNHERQVGHTVLYDKGVELCKNEIFTIFHADMVCGPNYLENLLKHLKPQTVVSATRIEPPLHPPGKEKIVADFGTYVEDFRADGLDHVFGFNDYCKFLQLDTNNKDVTTKGIFAPWMMYKKDFLAIGGHDKYFAPFPFEDSDIFQRFILVGYNIVQSRDAFVYHFTCRGHRWTKEVKKDDHFYKLCVAKNQAHYIRKWGSWIANDEFSHPIIHPKYDIGFKVKNCNRQALGLLEPWCSNIYTDCKERKEFIKQVQPGTMFDLSERIRGYEEFAENDVLVEFDANQLTQERFSFLTQLPQILKDSGEIGVMEHDIFTIAILDLIPTEKELIHNTDFFKQLLASPQDDPYNLNELFRVFENTTSQ